MGPIPEASSPEHVSAHEPAPSASPSAPALPGEHVRAASPSSLPPGTPAASDTGLDTGTTIHRSPKPINWLVAIPSILLSFQLAFTLIELIVAGWAANRIIDGYPLGNGATIPFLAAAIISGVVGGSAILIAAKDLYLRTPSTLDADKIMTPLDLCLSLLAFGLAWKEIALRQQPDYYVVEQMPGEQQPDYYVVEQMPGESKLQALEAFVILLFLLKLFKAASCFFNVFKRHGSYQKTCVSKPYGVESC